MKNINVLKTAITIVILTITSSVQLLSQKFNLPSDNRWYQVATVSGRHAFIEYIYSHPTANNPSIVKGSIQFINSQTHIIQEQQSMGYGSWNQPQFAIVNLGSSSELWVKATSGISNSGEFEIIYSKYANLVLGEVSDTDISNHGGSVKIYDKIPDNSHVFSGNIRFIDGSVGIGTYPVGTYKLAVDGTIGAREIKVETEDWSDFVFNKDYDLMNLNEVENFIEKNNHLPDIPSEDEVLKNGLQLGEMNAKLLQKIEELTLHLIKQNKEINNLKEKIQKIEVANK